MIIPTDVELEFHGVANIFPMMNGEEFAALVEDIKTNGLQEAIWLHEMQIVDGRNRYRACQEAGVEPQFREWDGKGSLVAFVVSLNLKRRHLTSSQKAMVALEVEKQLAVEARSNMSLGGQAHKGNQYLEGFQIFENLPVEPIHAAEQAATIVGTNRQYVIDAKKIAQQAPELTSEVLNGTLNITEAKAVAKLPETQRQTVIEKVKTGQDTKLAIKQVQREVRAALPQPELPATASIEHADNMAHIASDSIDLVLTDPPYGISGGGRVTKVSGQLLNADFDGDDDWDSDTEEEFLKKLDGWVKEWARVTRPGGAVIAFTDRVLISDLWRLFKAHGMKPKNVITWVKINPSPASLGRNNLLSATEFMVWAVKPGAKYTFNEVEGWDRRNVIVTSITSGGEKVDHPTQKPISVLSPLIELTTEPGDLVLDPFAGSGSSAVAALKLGRQAHLIERDIDYVRLAQQRVAEQGREQAVVGNTLF